MQGYGRDIEDQLSALLSQEMAKSIDLEIMRTLKNLGERERESKIESILEKIKNFNEKHK